LSASTHVVSSSNTNDQAQAGGLSSPAPVTPSSATNEAQTLTATSTENNDPLTRGVFMAKRSAISSALAHLATVATSKHEVQWIFANDWEKIRALAEEALGKKVRLSLNLPFPITSHTSHQTQLQPQNQTDKSR